MPLYDPPTTAYTSSPSPGATALRKVCMAHFSVGDLGIVRDRNRCPPNGPKSCHCDGARAWDPRVVAPSVVGDKLAAWLVQHADALDVQAVIWNRKVWGFGNWSWRAYTGDDPHTGHIHVELNRRGAATLTEAKVRSLLPGQPQPQPGGVFMALSDVEQKELLDKVRRLNKIFSQGGEDGQHASVGEYLEATYKNTQAIAKHVGVPDPHGVNPKDEIN